MNGSAHDIGLDEIDLAIGSRFRLLRFAPRLERQFDADVADERCKHMIWRNYIGLIIYHLFLFSDYCTIGDTFRFDLFMHFAVMTPVILSLNVLLSRRPRAWLREGAETFSLIILMAAIILVVNTSHSPFRDLVQLNVVLVILFVIFIQRLRFFYVLAACLSTHVVYTAGLMFIEPFSIERTIISDFLFAGILLFSLFGAYNVEREQRMAYLLRLRDRLRNCELETMNYQDALTGVNNRRALDSALARIAGKDGADDRTIAVLMLDIDRFKRFNDTNGHQEGDHCLVSIAGLVTASIRDSDGSVYRFGGEEFVVLLHGTSLEDALRVAERIRGNVARARIPCEPNAATFVSISIGVASARIDHLTTPTALIAAADRELYAAKRNGRDRVSPPSHANARGALDHALAS